MTRLLLCGGGGLALEVIEYLQSDLHVGALEGVSIGGFLDDAVDCALQRAHPGLPYLGRPVDFEPAAGDAVLICVGDVASRRRLGALLVERGATLFTYAHRSAWVSPTARLGAGALICPQSIVNAGAVVESNVAVNVFCSVGHGSRIGADSVLSPYCSLSGNSELGEACFMGTRATLFPNVIVGKGSVVDAHTAVKQSAPDGKIISVRGQYLVLDNRFAEGKVSAR